MAEGAQNGGGPSRGPLEQTLLAVLGLAALTVEETDGLADDLARRVGIERDAMRKAVRDALAAWRREAERFDAKRNHVADELVGRVGVVRKAEVDDLALRVAQLEHRLKLLERD